MFNFVTFYISIRVSILCVLSRKLLVLSKWNMFVNREEQEEKIMQTRIYF